MLINTEQKELYNLSFANDLTWQANATYIMALITYLILQNWRWRLA